MDRKLITELPQGKVSLTSRKKKTNFLLLLKDKNFIYLTKEYRCVSSLLYDSVLVKTKCVYCSADTENFDVS